MQSPIFPFPLAPRTSRRNTLYRFKGMRQKPKRLTQPLLVTEQGLSVLYRLSNPTNILFRYMYRDASNYKQHGEVIFSNQTFMPLPEIEKEIRATLKDGEFFIARQINIEERFFDALHDDDHPWHTFERIEVTTLNPFDPENWNQKQHRRDIVEFIADLDQAKRAGWDEMNVRADVQDLLEKQKQAIRKSLQVRGGHVKIPTMPNTHTVQVSRRGTITLPKDLRENNRIADGDRLTLIRLDEGVFILSKQRSRVDALADQLAAEWQGAGETLESILAMLREVRAEEDKKRSASNT